MKWFFVFYLVFLWLNYAEGKGVCQTGQVLACVDLPMDQIPSDPIPSEDFPVLADCKQLAKVDASKAKYPAGKRDIITAKEGFDGVESAIVDYRVKFVGTDFPWLKGGKLPGLGGGKATTGCAKVRDDGWSMRYMWRADGQAMVYAYDQNRKERCGDNYVFGTFKPDTWHRLTMRIDINTPGKRNGRMKVWFDEKLAFEKDDFEYRGKKADSDEALVDLLYWQTFRGGAASNADWYADKDTYAEFSDVIAYSCP